VKFKIALVQMRCSTDPADNLARALERIRAAARDGAQLICLPELFRTRYFCQSEDHAHFDLADKAHGDTQNAELKALIEKAKPVIQKHLDRAEALQKTLAKVTT